MQQVVVHRSAPPADRPGSEGSPPSAGIGVPDGWLEHRDASVTRTDPGRGPQPAPPSSPSRASAICPGVGGQPGMRRSTGRSVLDAGRRARRAGRGRRSRARSRRARRRGAARASPSYAIEQRLAHARRDRAGDEQHVGVAGRGDDVEAEALQVVVRVRRERELVLAAVARSGVDVAERERLRPRSARGRSIVAAQVAGGRGAARTSAVRAGVAELEALVDQREVGQQVAGGDARERRASSRTSRCAGAAARPRRPRARRRRSSRRAGSRRGRRRSLARRAPACRRPARAGAASRPSSSSKVCASSSARCSSRARTSPAARSTIAGREAVVGEQPPASARASSATPAARAAGPTAPRRAHLRASSTPTPISRSWNDALKSELAPGRARRRRAARAERVARALGRGRRRARARLPPTCTLSNRKRCPVELGVEALRALLAQGGEALVAGGEARRRRRRRRCR